MWQKRSTKRPSTNGTVKNTFASVASGSKAIYWPALQPIQNHSTKTRDNDTQWPILRPNPSPDKTAITTSPNKSPLPPLLLLPLELQREILSQMEHDPPSLLTLRLTCHSFHTLIPAPTLPLLLSAEKTPWAQTKGLFSCMECVRLRPAHTFADAMRKGKKGRWGSEPEKRFCVECGVGKRRGKGGRYTPGTEVVVEEKRGVVCLFCRKFKIDFVEDGALDTLKRGGEGVEEGKGKVVEMVGCKGSGACKECHLIRPRMCKLCDAGKADNGSESNRGRWGRFGNRYDYDDYYDEGYRYDDEDCESLDSDIYNEHFWETHDPSY